MPSFDDLMGALNSPTARGIYRGVGKAAPTIGAGIGTFLGGPGGGTALGGAAGSAFGSLLGYLGQETEEEKAAREAQREQIPEVAAQTRLLQQMQQPFQNQFAPIAAEEQRRFSQNIIPQIAERFAGRNSGAFRQQLSQAGQDLATRLASLGSQYNLQERGLEQQRQSQLGSYLAGQQQLGLGAQQLANQQQNTGIQGLLGGGRLGTQLGQLGMERELAPWYYQGGSPSIAGKTFGGLGQAVSAGAQLYNAIYG